MNIYGQSHLNKAELCHQMWRARGSLDVL